MGVSWKKSGKNLYQRWGRLEQVSRASNRDVVDCGDARGSVRIEAFRR